MIPGVIVGNVIDMRPAFEWLAEHPGATINDLLVELDDCLVGYEFTPVAPYSPPFSEVFVDMPREPASTDARLAAAIAVLGPPEVVRLALR